ncbi:MAG: hypothetical protein ACFCU2_08575 [Acidimicrobiia bacterium]
MTVKTHRKPKAVRYSMMESLGFTETPTVTYSTPIVANPGSPLPARHLAAAPSTRHGTVEEIWNTTELDAASMADWAPIDVEKRLNKRVRLPLVAIWVLIIGVIGGGGVWLWQNSHRTAESAIAEVQQAGAALGEALDPLAAAIASIDPAGGPVPETILPAVADADATSRALFTAAADLSGTQAGSRSVATDAATLTLDATRTLSNLSAYIGAVTPILTAPTLITEPELIDLQTAVAEFGSWRSTFGMVLSNLPEGVLPELTSELHAIRNDLEAMQGAYVDGLREDDRVAALDAVRVVEGRLATAWGILLVEVEAAKATITGQLDSAREAVLSLTG